MVCTNSTAYSTTNPLVTSTMATWIPFEWMVDTPTPFGHITNKVF